MCPTFGPLGPLQSKLRRRYLVGMCRPPHGATNRPPLTRPGNGYGRSIAPGPQRLLTPIRLESSAAERVLGLWAVDIDLVDAETAATGGSRLGSDRD